MLERTTGRGRAQTSSTPAECGIARERVMMRVIAGTGVRSVVETAGALGIERRNLELQRVHPVEVCQEVAKEGVPREL